MAACPLPRTTPNSPRIWSARPDKALTRRLRKEGFEVEVLPFHEPGRPSYDDRGVDTLWMARRP